MRLIAARKPLLMKFLDYEAPRFLVVGALNTGAGYLIYLGALQVVPYKSAYSISYVFGILASYFLNTRFVFREPWSWRKLASFPAVYVVQYFLGLGFLAILVGYLGVWEVIAPLLVVIATLPVTFVLSRYVIKWKKV